MIKKIALSLLMAVGVSTLSAQVPFQEGSLEDLIVAARESGKLVFTDFHANWCPPCRWMETNVISREDVGAYVGEHFVAGKFNIDDEQSGFLARQYRVTSIPTYIIFDKDGSKVAHINGTFSPEEFIDKLKLVVYENN